MIEEICHQLTAYEVTAVTRQNCDQVFEIYDTNQDFFVLSNGSAATLESSMQDVDRIPPGFDINKKALLCIWREGKAVGILDLLQGYPNHSCIWIGLLLIHGALHGNGIGQDIVTAVLNASKIEGYKSVQLGVIEHNLEGMAFWQRQGFVRVRNKDNIIVMEKLII